VIHNLKRFPEGSQFGQSQGDINHTQTRHGASDEIVEKKNAEAKRVAEEDVVFPQNGPWNKNQEETNLEAKEDKGDCEKPVHKGISHKEAQNSQNDFWSLLCLFVGKFPYPILGSAFNFLDAGGFTAKLANVIELGSADTSGADNLNLIDHGGVEWENAFHTMAERNLSDSERCARSAMFHSNADAFKNLDTFFVAFLDFDVNLDGVPRFEIRDTLTHLLFFDCFKCVHKASQRFFEI
jgi:hypothetical protein